MPAVGSVSACYWGRWIRQHGSKVQPPAMTVTVEYVVGTTVYQSIVLDSCMYYCNQLSIIQVWYVIAQIDPFHHLLQPCCSKSDVGECPSPWIAFLHSLPMISMSFHDHSVAIYYHDWFNIIWRPEISFMCNKTSSNLPYALFLLCNSQINQNSFSSFCYLWIYVQN